MTVNSFNSLLTATFHSQVFKTPSLCLSWKQSSLAINHHLRTTFQTASFGRRQLRYCAIQKEKFNKTPNSHFRWTVGMMAANLCTLISSNVITTDRRIYLCVMNDFSGERHIAAFLTTETLKVIKEIGVRQLLHC
jgi:hypothetical protein